MCAVAQENRQLKQLFPSQAFRIDYITYQPWDEYFPKLQTLRDSSVMSMASHFNTANLSKLSVMLLKYTTGIIVFLVLVAFTSFDSAFNWQNMIVLLGTLGQAVTVLFAVHWYYCRLDLSLDAVIKYFASGFFFATSLAMIFEMLVSILLQFIVGVLMVVMEYEFIASYNDSGQDNNVDPQTQGPTISDISKQFAHDYPWIMSIYLFMNAFVVAAMIEELCKYFGFKMLRHPDLEQSELERKDYNTFGLDEDTSILSTGSANLEERALQSRIVSSKSQGAAITVAMVAAATGFACCENLVYVFSYSGGSLENEIGVLIARSFFPVHPIAAAIQSINVVRRDIEGESFIQIGKIIVPAIILHGSFDFSLMLLGFLAQLNSGDDDDSAPTDDQNAADDEEELGGMTILSLALSVLAVLSGLVYYFYSARKQRARLETLDNTIGMTLIEGTII